MSAAGVDRSGDANVDWATDLGAVSGWGVGSISKNRPISIHTISISLQNSFCQAKNCIKETAGLLYLLQIAC